MSTIVTYECDHTAIFKTAPPRVGDTVFCIRCNTDRVVVKAPHEYRISCRVCTFGRAYGVARLAAEIAAAKHANKHGHRVRLYDGPKLVRVIGDTTRPLSLVHKDPPF